MVAFVEKEVQVEIPGPCGALEAKAQAAKGSGPLAGRDLLAVVCHPHPLQGGTMDYKVVTILARTYRDLGIPVVRFNFRGVGASQGAFDHAVGEVEDLMAVIRWGEGQLPGRRLALAGFSFGSSVAAQASHHLPNLAHLALVAPPVTRYPFDRNRRFPAPACVIQGGQDELVSVEEVCRWTKRLLSPVELVRDEGASHFFHGRLMPLKRRLTEVLLRRLA